MVKIDHLVSGSWYRFDHIRKGPFMGRFVDSVPNYNDETDPQLLEVDVWTEDGSGQERFANAMDYSDGGKRHPKFSPKLIRPSLLRSIMTPSSKEQRHWQNVEESVQKPGIKTDIPAQDIPSPPREEKPLWKRLLRLGE